MTRQCHVFAALVAFLVMLLVQVQGQGCATTYTLYTMVGTVEIDSSTPITNGPACWQILPQPPNAYQEVTSIDFQLEPNYTLIGTDEIDVWSQWYPMPSDRWLLANWSGAVSPNISPNQTFATPYMTIVYNATFGALSPFTISYAAQTSAYKTKFSVGLFAGTVILLIAPVLCVAFSMCTFRRGFCNKASKNRRLSRKTPLAERLLTGTVAGVGLVLFFLLVGRAFG